MKPTITIRTIAFLLALISSVAHGAEETPHALRSNNRALVGVGGSFITERNDVIVIPGFMLGYEFALGDRAAIALTSDFSVEKNGSQPDTRSLVDVDLKLMTASSGSFHPWLLLGAALSASPIDAGLGFGGGLGGYFGSSAGHSYFVDVRAYHITNMESDNSTQTTMRLGLAF